MIVEDHTLASLAASGALAIALLIPGANAALAEGTASTATTVSSPAAETAPAPATVTLVSDGTESTFTTNAHTVSDLLAERGIQVGAGDYVSSELSALVSDGIRVVVRTAQPVRLQVDSGVHVVRSTAETVADFLRDQRVPIGRSDEVTPAPTSPLVSGETVSVVRVRSWTSHERMGIAPKVEHRTDKTLPLGQTVTLSSGRPGLRETVVRFTRRGAGATTSTIVASRIVRAPRSKVVIQGLATYASLARVASQGFQSALHMAGTALHMIATAYTASCDGCSGITASGVRAGFGIIAVDPRMIPLGTRVFIPGYGRAVAGDTGGAIQGHRVDLGFDTQSGARQFGRRPITLYVLR